MQSSWRVWCRFNVSGHCSKSYLKSILHFHMTSTTLNYEQCPQPSAQCFIEDSHFKSKKIHRVPFDRLLIRNKHYCINEKRVLNCTEPVCFFYAFRILLKILLCSNPQFLQQPKKKEKSQKLEDTGPEFWSHSLLPRCTACLILIVFLI